LSLVDESKNPVARAGPLTATRARVASLEELRRHLTSAPGAYLQGAVQNPELTPDEMALLLRNRLAPPGLLARVGQDRQWTRYYEVKRGLVRHPRTPYPVARSLIGHLYWRDLAEVIEDARLHPALRRQAEQVLEERLPEMSLGEQISLARRSTGNLISTLRGSGDARVLRALLGNPRLKEQDAETVASGEEVPGDVLGWLTRHGKWGNRRAVRMALVRNARTPVADALKLVAKLPRKDLEQLADDDGIPKIVRVGAVRRLEPEGD
jgi:hypothetical protein